MKMSKCRKFFVLTAGTLMLAMLCLGTTGCLSVKVFHQLAIDPNDQFYEFGQSEELYEGSYLGTEIRQGRRMHHYCFGGQQRPGVLEGTGRWLHMYIDADGYGQALAFENDACGLPEVAPACLVFGVHPPHYYPKERVDEEIQKLPVSGDHPAVLCTRWEGDDKITVFLPEDMSENGVGDKTWEGPIDVDWKVRSKTMAFIRPIYALPVALLCLPIDIMSLAFLPYYIYIAYEGRDC